MRFIHFSVATQIICLAGMLLGQTVSDTDGRTPTGIQPGTPAGAYSVSGLDTVNLFNGHLSFSVPIRQIVGRGESGYQTVVPVERNWTLDYSYDAQTNVEYWFPRTELQPRSHWWSDSVFVPQFSPGMLLIRRSTSGRTLCENPLPISITTAVRTTITFVNETGSESELVDRQFGGGVGTVACSDVVLGSPEIWGTNRKRIFESRDGSSMTFISDSDVKDSGLDTNMHEFNATGWLYFKNGTRYRVEEGLIRRIYDRNGNRTSILYSATRDVQSITDPIGRVTTISASANAVTMSFPGENNITRSVTVRYAQLSDRLGKELDSNGIGGIAAIQSYAALFGSFGPSSTLFNPILISEIELPNGKKYQFRYNSYAELVQVQLPTGGQYRYRHGPGKGSFSVVGNVGGRAGVYRRVFQKWTYVNGFDDPSIAPGTPLGRIDYEVSHSPVSASASTYFLYSMTTATMSTFNGSGLLLAKSKHYFNGGVDDDRNKGQTDISYNNWRQGVEYTTEHFQIDNGALLRRVEREHQPRPCDISGGEVCIQGSSVNASYIGYFNQDPQIRAEKASIWNAGTGLMSRTELDYDRYNNQAEVREFAFGASAATPIPGAQIRRSVLEYKTTPSSYLQVAMNGQIPDPFATVHLRGLRERSTVYDATGTLTERQEMEYDGLALTNTAGTPNEHPLTPISGEPIWNTSWTARGNATKVKTFLAMTSVGESDRYLESIMEYDVVGNLLKKTDPGARITSIEYADRCASGSVLNGTYAFATRTSNALSQVLENTFDCYLGAIVATREKNAQSGIDAVTSYTYTDPLDRLKSITPPTGSTLYFYDDTALTATASVAQNSCSATNQNIASVRRFDGLGRAVREEGSDQQGSFFGEQELDVLGRVVKSHAVRRSAEAQSTTQLEYDGLGRLIKTTMADGAIRQVNYVLNIATGTDEAMVKKSEEQDALGRLVRVVEDPQGAAHATDYQYDAKDRLVKVIQGDQERNYRYDSAGRLRCASNPEARVGATSCLSINMPADGVLLYGYDDRGNLTSRKDARGLSTNYTIDALDRVTGIAYPARPQANVTQAYDTCRLGKLCSAVNSYGGNTMTYDLAGRLTASSQQTGANAYSFAYGLNLAGGVDEITYPSGNKVRSCQDTGARTREVTRTKGAVTSSIATALQYEGDGALQAMTLGNGVKELLCRNSRRQTTGWVVRAGSASGCEASLQDLLNTTSDYGNSTMNNGNVRGQGWSLYLPGSVIRSYQQTHTYDSLNRLRTTSEANTTANGPWALTNGYDRYGNRYVETAMTSGLTMTPGTPVGAGWFSSTTNRLTQGSGGVAASFDGAGNLIGHPDLGSMTYDEENRMLTWAEGGITVSQVYDGAGRRVQRVKGTRTTTYVYEAGGQLMAEYDTAPEAVTEAMQYRHGDMLDSTRLLTGGSGQVIWRQDYFPFGEEIAGASSLGRRNEIPGYGVGSAVKQRFTGKEREAESELDYFGARFLSASLGRFTGADAPFADQEVHNPQSWNLYSYVRNSPLVFIDPTGRCSKKGGSDKATDDIDEPCVAPGSTSVTVFLNDSLDPLEVVSSFIAGRLPPVMNFSKDSVLSLELMGSRHITDLLRNLQAQFNNCGNPSEGLNPRSLGKWPLPMRLARIAGDAVNIATKGATGNLTASILGSYSLSYSVGNVDQGSGTATVNMVATNPMTFQSGFRNPFTMEDASMPAAIGLTGAMKPVQMAMHMSAQIRFNNAGCPAQ